MFRSRSYQSSKSGRAGAYSRETRASAQEPFFTKGSSAMLGGTSAPDEKLQGGSRPATNLQGGCGPAAAAAGSSGCRQESGNPAGEKILFRVNCDDLLDASQRSRISAFADSMNDTDTVNVHGFASVDGPVAFNDQLSCARAKKVADLLVGKGIPESRINTVQHGATAGPAASERSVILELASGVSRQTVPQLTAIPQTVASNGCSDLTFPIVWDLSRKAAPTGGFILQEITITRLAFDCNGLLIPSKRFANPVHYFEAWPVTGGTTTITPANTDTFHFQTQAPDHTTCTSGVAVFSAVAQYHDNVSALPGTMIPSNPATPAGILPSSLANPNLGGNVSRSVPHELSYHWNCCPCSSSPNVIDSKTPS